MFAVGAFFAGHRTAVAADGPTPPAIADPVGSNVAPHGGYSSSTNMCLQCHKVHKAPGVGYALGYETSTTRTCGTCHMIFADEIGCMACHPHYGIPVPPDPVGTGLRGTVSDRRVDFPYSTETAAGGHRLGAADIPGETGRVITQADWTFSDYPPTIPATTPSGLGTAGDGTTYSSPTGGLYCLSCHTPHGDSGQVVNRWTSADEGRQIWSTDASGNPVQKYLHASGNVWQVCDTTGNVNCAWAQVRDAKGQLVYLYGYKLLSTYPNHTYGAPQTYRTQQGNIDGSRWCVACHTTRLDTSLGGAYHNHATGCDYCHGNDPSASWSDFPHGSATTALLKALPDGLCVSCHPEGLP